MAPEPSTLLAIFAHPDDEIGVGSTLSCYGDAGMRTVLVCATRGEAATIYCDGCATPENLGEVRTHELECACSHLGIRELCWLDWPDGGVQTMPRAEAIAQVVAHIRQFRPQVIVTHPETGLYPHPDHVAVWEIVRAAFDAAGDPDCCPEAGPAWQAARLFSRAIPQSFFDAAPAFAQARVQLNGQELPFYGTPDAEIDVIMHVAAWAHRRVAAWDCHRSQHNPDGAFTLIPEEIRRVMAETEHFVLAAAAVPLPEGATDDLLAGLPAAGLTDVPCTRRGTLSGSESRSAPPDATSQRSEAAPQLAVQEPGKPPEVGAGQETAFPVVLASELAVHRSLADLCRSYQPGIDEPKLAQSLRRTAEVEQEIIYRLAHALRLAGAAPGAVEPNSEIIAAGGRVPDAPGKLGYLADQMRQAAIRYRTQAQTTCDDPERAFWAELAALTEKQALPAS